MPRIYREEGLMVRLTPRRKRASQLRVPTPQPRQLNQRWKMDFVADTLLDGRRFRTLTVIDNWSRHSQLLEVDFTLTRTKVVTALERLAKRSGYPQVTTVDNGSEFASKALDAYPFESLDLVRAISAEWMREYNEERPHDALARVPPATYRAQITVTSPRKTTAF